MISNKTSTVRIALSRSRSPRLLSPGAVAHYPRSLSRRPSLVLRCSHPRSHPRRSIGTVGNQFALTTIISFLVSLPFMYFKEGSKWGEFVELFNSNNIVKVRPTNELNLKITLNFILCLPSLTALQLQLHRTT